MSKHPNRAIAAWLLAGVVSYLAFPWYAIQDTAWYEVLTQVFAGTDTANGLIQAFSHDRPWLLAGAAGLLIAAVGLTIPAGKRQGMWLIGGASLGLLGLVGGGFARQFGQFHDPDLLGKPVGQIPGDLVFRDLHSP